MLPLKEHIYMRNPNVREGAMSSNFPNSDELMVGINLRAFNTK